MTSMRIIRSDGRELTAADGWQGWLIADGGLDDWLDLDINITTAANVLTDGSRLVSKRVEECERTASILYVGSRDWAEVRDEILSFLSPKHTFKVYVTHAGRTRWAEGELSARSVPLEPEGGRAGRHSRSCAAIRTFAARTPTSTPSATRLLVSDGRSSRSPRPSFRA